MESTQPYEKMESKKNIPRKNISIDFNEIDNKTDDILCNKKLIYKLFENFFLLLNICVLALGGYNISDYIFTGKYSLIFTLLTISVFMGIFNIIYFIYIIRKDAIEIRKSNYIIFYIFILSSLIYNSCILGEFYKGNIIMESISIIYICLSLFIDVSKQVYWLCLIQVKYKLFPNAISSPQSNILDNTFSQNEKRKSQRIVDIV
tara:strand:- start:41 stop:652 length:612 start_codon:yes stop_codon:yes gene_type:complete